jgi:hypothetical protein
MVLQLTGPAPAPSVDDVLAAAGRYAESFRDKFKVVISDERYRQRLRRTEDRDSRSVRSGGQRDIRSEMLFLGLADERTWLTVRSVQRVDGRAVGDSRQRLEQVLAEPPAERSARLRQVLDESARFNLGQIARNFSDPTLVLQFLQPAVQPRFSFTLGEVGRKGDLDAVRVDFAERAAPTVVTLNGQDLLSRGSVWISRADGIVIETELHQASKAINLEAQMRVTFRRQASLDLWVPVRMDELYKQQQVGWWGTPPRTAVVAETIECTATYSNYRRFETSGRVLVPEP